MASVLTIATVYGLTQHMELCTVGYYHGRQQARVPISKGALRSAFDTRPEQVRAEIMDGRIILTNIREPAWLNRD